MINIPGIGLVEINSPEHLAYIEKQAILEWEEKTLEEVLVEVRAKRIGLLTSSDIYMLSDHPIRATKTEVEILAYRQALRDFPETITEKPISMDAIVYPTL